MAEKSTWTHPIPPDPSSVLNCPSILKTLQESMNDQLTKILFIDDDQDIHMIVEVSLDGMANLELRSALSGEEGIKMAMEFMPDLILLDVMMPGMDGINTLKAMRLLPNLAQIPVVFMTARAQGNEVMEYLQAGAIDVIIKPFDPMTLQQTLVEIWKKRAVK